jgi:hypothetical protein
VIVEGSTAGEIEKLSAIEPLLHVVCSYEILWLFLGSLSLGFSDVHWMLHLC